MMMARSGPRRAGITQKVASASPSYPLDLAEKVRKAKATRGPAYIHMYSACPTGWRMAPDLAIEIGRLATETGVFPLYEIVDGQMRLTYPVEKLRPVTEYLKPQGRFRHLMTEDNKHVVEEIGRRLAAEYEALVARAEREGGIG